MTNYQKIILLTWLEIDKISFPIEGNIQPDFTLGLELKINIHWPSG